ncbi:MAG TPA: NAD(P)H-quinone oxidoreductase [Pyrinomonadaceae bacterium]|jgi:putative PIG3 family NAD(P)H quinone oxidoreductase|nr:NAD(P)H-quinone oxidoreductase [Pyrinomonadaceae bacterium]
MKAIVITRFGGPEVLEIQEVATPQPGADEVLVRVRSTALNRADLLQRAGGYAAPPDAPQNISGLEFAGEVAELGTNAHRWSKGDRVMGIVGGGAHAEFVTAHQDAVAAVPSNVDVSVAGAIPEVFVTAHDALQQAAFKAGENVLVHAVGSGVGLAATQLVKALGGHAFGTSRTPDKIERAKEFGLESGYAVPEPDALTKLSAFAENATGGHGFDVVLDLNGGPYFAASLEAMALKGRLILIGGVAGGKTEVALYQILRKRLHIIGTVMRARSLQEKVAITTSFASDVVPLLAQDAIRPVIDSVFPIEQVQDAHRRLESNETFGKVVLTI